MKKCDYCDKEDTLMPIKVYNLFFCSPKCMVAYTDEFDVRLQDTEQYKRYTTPEVVEEPIKVQGCTNPSCGCKLPTSLLSDKSCICRTFNSKDLLKKALKDD